MKEIKTVINKQSGFRTSGVGIGKTLTLNSIDLEVLKEIVEDTEGEILLFKESVLAASKDIEKLTQISEIFSAHLAIANDPIFHDNVIDYIKLNKVSAPYAIKEITKSYLETFSNIYNPYLQERKADILDVTNQILAKSLNIELKLASNISEDVIIVADNLSPSETATLDLNYVKGLVLFNSGITSHTAIIAKLNNIPLIINSELNYDKIKDDILTILDASNNIIIQNPLDNTLKDYRELIALNKTYFDSLVAFEDKETFTKDEEKINLMMNINGLEDLEDLDNLVVDGVGLFRTEFLYMDKIPTLAEQIEIYQTVLTRFKDSSVTIRIFDLGGDKPIKGLGNVSEENPFLGVRGIRYALKNKDILKVQIKALLKANIYGNLKILIPMIASLEELLEIKALIKAIHKDLELEGYSISPYEIGIMIEVPIAAINAPIFAKHVDFFSIGTNDLIQYTFAADRMNSNLSYLYQSLNPGLLALITHVAKTGLEHNIDVSVCGEMAGDLTAIPFLIGANIKTLSMSKSSILPSKELISKTLFTEAKALLEQALLKDSQQDIINLLNE